MSKVLIDRFAWVDDSGSGNDGTIINNVQLQMVFDAIDAAITPIVQAKSGAYTVLDSDDLIKVLSGTWTLSLFTAVGHDGKVLTIVNTGTGTITIDPYGSETVNAQSTFKLSGKHALVITSDGANWLVRSYGYPPESDQMVLAGQVFS